MPDNSDEPIKILEKVDKNAPKKQKTNKEEDDDDKSSIVSRYYSHISGSNDNEGVKSSSHDLATGESSQEGQTYKNGGDSVVKLEVTDHSVDKLMTTGEQPTPQPTVLQKVFLTSTPKPLKETPKKEIKTEPVDLRKVSSSVQTDSRGISPPTPNYTATHQSLDYATPAQQSTNHFPSLPFSQISQTLPRSTLFTSTTNTSTPTSRQPYQQFQA